MRWTIVLSLCLPTAAAGRAPASGSALRRADTLNAYGYRCGTALGEPPARWKRITSTRAYRMTYAAVPLIVAGALVNGQRERFGDLRNHYLPYFRHHYDDYLQYAPLALTFGLKAAGVQSRSSWGRMMVSDAFSAALMAGMVNALKYTVCQERPDGSGRNSFPSGHTATAFMAATVLHKEYGLTRSPWYSIGGYTVATVVGLSRQMNNKHWLSDVLVGAGIGILSTELGYWFADMIYGKRGLELPERDYTLHGRIRPSFLGLYVGFDRLHVALPELPGIRLHPETGATIGAEGAWFFSPYVGVGGRMALTSLPLDMDKGLFTATYPGLAGRGRIEAEPLGVAHLMGGAYFSFPLARRWLLGSKLLAGYWRVMSARISAVVPAGAGETLRRRLVTVGEGGGAGFGTGLSLSFLARPGFGMKLFCDLNLSPKRVPVTAWELSGESVAAQTRGGCLSTALGASLCVMFRTR